MHDHSLVKEFINDKDNTAHVIYQSFSFNVVSEYTIEAFVYAVEDHAKNEFVVITVADDEDCEITVHSEYGNIVVYSHYVVLERVSPTSTRATLFARLQENLFLERFL